MHNLLFKHYSMKITLLLLSLFLIPFSGTAQDEKQIDSTAIFILDKMSAVLSELHSTSLSLESSIDQVNEYAELEKHYGTSEVIFSGPSKLSVQNHGDKGHIGYWYDGEFISYYNYDENNYVTLEAPDSTLTMINEMHETYDFQFPAADFFYPTFVDDLMENFDTISYLGVKKIDSQECFNIMCVNESMNVQFWISNEDTMLPRRLVIIYKNENNRQYEATFTEWKLNPIIPDAIFDFLPPPNAKLISILAKS